VQIAIRAYGSATSGAVGDSTLSAIDRLFDFVDNGVEQIDRALNRGKYTEEQHRSRHAKRPKVIAAQPAPKAPKKKAAAAPTPTSSALVCKPRFYIVESISPSGTLFVVTDGGSARAECSTRELAEKLLRSLEAA
jgi:hypothetical protein